MHGSLRALVVSTLVACSGASDVSAPPGGADALAGVDTTDSGPGAETLFGFERVLDVTVVMAAADWDSLRFESPGLDFLISETCPPGPRPRPYAWYPATVTIDGEEIAAQVRKKGWYGSMDPTKPSLKVRRAGGGDIRGLSRLTFNNDKSDGSHLRQCLAYKLFAAAGLPASRCGFAAVTVNGTRLGVFTHVESIEAGYLERHFGDATGDLYEAQLSDFRDPQLQMFEPKNSHTDATRAPLYALADALLKPEGDLLTEVGGVVDLDHFYTHWAMETLTGFWDGYTGNLNNFYVYRSPGDGLLRFIPWGVDETFKAAWDWADGHVGALGDMPWVVYANALLPYRLLAHAEGRARYAARLQALLADVWREDELVVWIDATASLIAPHLRAAYAADYPARVGAVRDFVLAHRARLEAGLAEGLPAWERGLRMITCAEVRRHLTGSFWTTWDTLGADVLETGDGALVETVDGAATEAALVRALAGPRDMGATARFQVGLGPLENGRFGFAEIDVPMELLVPGTIAVDGGQAGGRYGFVDISTFAADAVGFILTGSITFEEVDTSAGGTIRATVDLPIASIVWDTSEPVIPNAR